MHRKRKFLTEVVSWNSIRKAEWRNNIIKAVRRNGVRKVVQRNNIWRNGVWQNGILAVAVAMLIFFGVHFSVSARELRELSVSHVVDTIDKDIYEIPEEYHFSAQIQRDENGNILTEFVPFGTWNNEQAHMAAIDGDFVITCITGDRNKGNLGAWYYNVGCYRGKTVDLKCTIEDYMQRGGPEDTSGMNLGWVALAKERLGVYIRHLQWVDLKLEFFDAKTGEPLTIQSSAVITDVDAGEGMSILSGYESLMVSENCTLQKYDMDGRVLFVEAQEKDAYEETKDDWAQVQVFFESSEFRYRIYSAEGVEKLFEEKLSEGKNTEDGNTENENIEDLNIENENIEIENLENKNIENENTEVEKAEDDIEIIIEDAINGPTAPEFMLHFQGYSDCRLAPLTAGAGNMTVSDSDEVRKEECLLNHREEAFAYEMRYKVSPEYENWYYDSFVVTGHLPEEVSYQSGTVATGDGQNVMDQFYIREKDGLVTFEAKQVKNRLFYGKTYIFTVNVKLKDGADIESSWKESRYSWPFACRVEIQRGDTPDVKNMEAACANLVSEYIQGEVLVSLKDALSGAVLTDGEIMLLQWSERENAYVEIGRTSYSKEQEGYWFSNLTKNHDNRGRYKVMESKLPEHYLGSWEQKFEITQNGEMVAFTGTNQPTGETLVRMTSKIIREVDGESVLSEECGSQDAPVVVERGERIQYHIYVERDSAPTFKSGELVLTNKIPDGLLYEKETLHLIGEIIHPVENSTAKIASVRLTKEGVLTWKINHLDDGEVAHVIFEVDVPEMTALNLAADCGGVVQNMEEGNGVSIDAKNGIENEQDVLESDDTLQKMQGYIFTDYAELVDGEQTVTSNVLEHELHLPELKLELQATPGEDVVVHPREILEYTFTAKNKGTADAKNVILRLVLPDGLRYVEDSISCDREDVSLHLAKDTAENGGACKIVYGIIPQLEVDEQVSMKVKLYVERDYSENTVEVWAEIKEVWQDEADLYQVALEIDGYQKSEVLMHKVEAYPEIEAPETDGESGTENDGNEGNTSENGENVTGSEGNTSENGECDSGNTGDISGNEGNNSGNNENTSGSSGGTINGNESGEQNHSVISPEEVEENLTKGNTKEQGSAAKTGDSAKVGFYAGIGILSILAFLLCIFRYKQWIK